MKEKTVNMSKIVLEIDKEAFVDHVRRICRGNIRKPCKICLVCPFRKYVLEIMEENGWKMPETKGERE
jgi:hypothetical protein